MPQSALRWRLKLFAFAFVAVGSWYLTLGLESVFAFVNIFIQREVESNLSLSSSNPLRLYAMNATLDNITAIQQSDPDHIALKIYCEVVPGYLRGRTFDVFLPAQNRWETVSGAQTQTLAPCRPEPVEIKVDSNHQVFELQSPPKGRWRRIEIQNEPLRGNVFFLPTDSIYVAGRGTRLIVNSDGAVLRGLSVNESYAAYVCQKSTRTELPALRQESLTSVPSTFSQNPEIEKLSQEIFQSAKTTVEKIEALELFFNENFKYSLDQKWVAPSGERLEYFLINRPPAHCEFFATSAALLLRLQGVPTRYVTGFTSTELDSEYQDFYLARNRNAHAWTEAFDSDEGVWKIVEATPGLKLPKKLWPEDELSTEEGMEDDLDDGQSMQTAWSKWKRQVWEFIRDPFGIMDGEGNLTILFILIGLIGWLYYLERHRIKAWRFGLKSPSRRLRKLERTLRRFSLIRAPDETLHQFAYRVKATRPGDDRVIKSAEAILEFAIQKYGRKTTFDVSS
jgi:protein-glutamine gamma-glutamyltransferase